jgi:2-polyprenyl-6-methoxyphenol hydroxylase-like FAD-dependent oxidoreductase
MDRISCDCCIVGGGPAGMMLALLLARANVRVVVLEKHGDFLRDFRGDTVHPSTLELLQELGIKERFDRLPQQRAEQLKVMFADGLHAVGDFRSIKPFPYVSFVPQWDFLDFLTDEARRFSGFELRMNHDAFDLLHDRGRVTGVRAAAASGEVEIEAKLVVACDGRHSSLRKAAGMAAEDLGAPMDVLWFRLPRKSGDPEDSFGVAERGRLLVLINRREYWQIAYIIPKGYADTLQRQPIGTFRTDLARRLPLLADRVAALAGWNAVKLLDVRVDRLRRWHKPGLLVIGDAAHAMSPIGGVGINLAIQDAVAAANWISAPLSRGEAPARWRLAAVQWRRRIPTDLVQSVQRLIQRLLIAPALAASGDPTPLRMPQLLRVALRFDGMRAIPARLFGVGPWREHIHAR